MLVGNGLSIAFNPGLNLQAITEEVMRRIEAADGGDVIAAMKELAERALPRGVNSATDFELLVGAFGAESRALNTLETLATLTSPTDTGLQAAIRRVEGFATDVRDNGVSHVLQVISERSSARGKDAAELRKLVRALVDAFTGNVVIGNLNYDTLLLATLLKVCGAKAVVDLGHGWKKAAVLVNEQEEVLVPALRETGSDFPPGPGLRLLHLHGSLTYWANREDGSYVKLPRSMLEDGAQWQAVRDKSTNVRPVVVLANQHDKAQHVSEYPFSLAYEMFHGGLDQSSHWTVIGYSFKDEPVNERLRRAFLDREQKPRVLVVTIGDSPARPEVERAFGWGADDGDSSWWLTINRDGAYGVQDTDDWKYFVDD